MRLKIICLIAILALAGCAQETTKKANPASEHCIDEGGTLKIVDTEDGQVGMCELPDGTVCEEWDFYRGECPVNETTNITSFEECVDAGNNVMESYPRKCEANGKVFVENLTLQEKCENQHNGKWLEEFSECEGVEESACREMKGNFNQCASACRHDPDAEVCTMQCVPVCSFGQTNLQEKCEIDGGKWLPKHQECEFMSEEKCTETGGKFFSCESACRHTDSDVCTEQCVPVCKYET